MRSITHAAASCHQPCVCVQPWEGGGVTPVAEEALTADPQSGPRSKSRRTCDKQCERRVRVVTISERCNASSAGGAITGKRRQVRLHRSPFTTRCAPPHTQRPRLSGGCQQLCGL